MKSPEEIKKGLECHTRLCGCDMGCPYVDMCRESEGCPMSADALAYIQQLENENEKLLKMLDVVSNRAASIEGASVHAVEQMADRIPRWIPVEERLPEEGVDVVIRYGKDGFCEVASRSGDNWHCAEYVVLGGEWITHWMPLPSTEGLHDN